MTIVPLEDGRQDMGVAVPARSGALRAEPQASQAEPPAANADDIQAAINLAFGLLWHMEIDTRNDNLRLASDARKALWAVMSKDDQADGITRAKMTDGRFTGAA